MMKILEKRLMQNPMQMGFETILQKGIEKIRYQKYNRIPPELFQMKFLYSVFIKIFAST